jgi:hypothetical protein
MKKIIAGMALCGTAFAGETLFGNCVYAIAPGGSNGTLWAFSHDNTYSGVTRLNFNVSDKGNVSVESTGQAQVSDTLTAVQTGLFDDDLAERRRVPAIYTDSKLGFVLPMYAMDNNDRFMQPAGYFNIRDLNSVIENPVEAPAAADDLEKPMQYAMTGFAYDSTAKRLWIARGALGVMVHDISGKKNTDTTFVLNTKTNKLEKLKDNAQLDLENNPEVFDVRLHPETGELWLATAKGLWVNTSSGLKNISKNLKDSRVTGLWMGGDPLTIIAETSRMEKESMKGALWVLREGDKDFAKAVFLDTAGKKQKKDIYDEGDYTVSDVAFVGNTAFVAVAVSGGDVSGYFKLDSAGIRAWDADDDGKSVWLYGYATGAIDRDFRITSICSFPLAKNVTGLALATYGNGISVSADTGKTWTPILNRAKLGNDLGSVRMVPSVITAGDQSLVSYKVSKDSKITIDVFSYDMRKIRTIVKSAPRGADASRSTNPKEDFWDGKDKAGRPCTMGVYYVRVKDNHGHIGWGKVMTLGGHK